MRVFAGMHHGAMTVSGEALLLKGMVYGDLLVEGQAEVEMRGMIFGNVLLTGGSMRLTGMVSGDVTNTGGQLSVTGMVKGDLSLRARWDDNARQGVSTLGSESTFPHGLSS